MTRELLLAALVLGISVAAPLGPVGLAAIRTGLVRGAATGWLVGLGAAVTDSAYLLLVNNGLLPLLERLTWLGPVLGVAGAVLLARMAWAALKGAWSGDVGEGRDAGRSGWGAFWWGVGITAINPMTIASWLSVGGAFGVTYLAGLGPWVSALALLTIGLGSALWFTLLALLVAVARSLVAGRQWVLRGVNLLSSLMLLWFAGVLLIRPFIG